MRELRFLVRDLPSPALYPGNLWDSSLGYGLANPQGTDSVYPGLMRLQQPTGWSRRRSVPSPVLICVQRPPALASLTKSSIPSVQRAQSPCLVCVSFGGNATAGDTQVQQYKDPMEWKCWATLTGPRWWPLFHPGHVWSLWSWKGRAGVRTGQGSISTARHATKALSLEGV